MTGAPDTAYCATCGHGAECLCTSTPAYESPPTLEDIMAEIVKINERLDALERVIVVNAPALATRAELGAEVAKLLEEHRS